MESVHQVDLAMEEFSKDTGKISVSSGVSEQGVLAIINSLEKASLTEAQPTGLIDTSEAVAFLVSTLSSLPTHPPSIYVDLEGVELSRRGTISILQLFILPTNRTYLIDVHSLGEAVFTTPSSDGQTLKDILESDDVPKAFFDVRNDSDALHSHFGINLAGICDIQLMELATRSFSKRCVNGLAKCIERDLEMTKKERQDWLANKEAGKKLFAPECGGSYEVFNVRPLSETILQYCKQDVQYLPRLWQYYSLKLTTRWAMRVKEATKDRVKLSQAASFIGKGRHMALGPWK